MSDMNQQKCVIYIGDFDLRNQNVQAHLVKNNAKILNRLGYNVAFIGVNREATWEEIDKSPKIDVGVGNIFFELQNTLTVGGLFNYHKTEKRIMSCMDEVTDKMDVHFVISYQSPTYAPILKRIAKWCKKRRIKYIVNCADITIFNSQPLFRRFVMTLNWNYLHKINKKYMDGLISVSRYIEKFYHKEGTPSVIIPPLYDESVDNNYYTSDVTTFVYAGTPFVIKKNVNTKGMKDRLDKILDLCLILSKEGVEYRLEIIGITRDVYTLCVPRHKAALETNSNIEFLGRMSHKDTLKEVKNADFMINIRDRNVMNEAGLSTKLVESVSLGTPVVMNSIGDTFLYLHEGVSGFKFTGDVQNDVQLLKTLCSMTKDERKSLKIECANDKTFSLQKYQMTFESFLEETLAITNN